jgi:hypothetical protein
MDLKNLKHWIDTIFHHHGNGTLPPAPTNAPVSINPAPSGGGMWTHGMSQPDDRGAVMLQAVEAKRASDPKWAGVTKWFFIKDAVTTFYTGKDVPLDLSANLEDAALMLSPAISGGAYHLDGRGLYSAYAYTAAEPGSGAKFVRGAEMTDAQAFPGDNVVNGVVLKAGPDISVIDAFIANCDATGNLPVVAHSQANVA